jgi:hypothetical protein
MNQIIHFDIKLIKMGILKLMDFLKDKFPRCVQDILPSALKGKVIAIDASNVIYQFLVQTQGKSSRIISHHN